MLKIVITGLDSETADANIIISVNKDEPNQVYFEDTGFACLASDLEQAVAFLKEYMEV